MRQICAFLFGFLISAALASPSSATAHQGYHDTGAQTLVQRWGAYAEIEVTNVDVPANTGDFFAARILGKEGAGACNEVLTPYWVEVGWAEGGWPDHLVNGQPLRSIYTWAATDDPDHHCRWKFYNYAINVGQKIYVRLVPDGFCDSTPGCTWLPELYWSNQWQVLEDSYYLFVPNYSMNFEEMAEPWFDTWPPGTSTHWNIAGQSQGYNVNWDNTRVRTNAGIMVPWDATVTSQAGDATPYFTGWGQQWNYFNSHRTCTPPCG